MFVSRFVRPSVVNAAASCGRRRPGLFQLEPESPEPGEFLGASAYVDLDDAGLRSAHLGITAGARTRTEAW